jgi:hypothetical protein
LNANSVVLKQLRALADSVQSGCDIIEVLIGYFSSLLFDRMAFNLPEIFDRTSGQSEAYLAA